MGEAMNEQDAKFAAFLMASLCAFTGFMFYNIGYEQGAGKFRREAVEKGHAEYDSQTGKWKWSESLKPTP